MEEEIWKFVPGYEGLYMVSNLGRVKSLGNGKTHKTEQILRPCKVRGYLLAALYKDGKQKKYLVHRLVWEAFNGPIPKGMQINHISERKDQNNLENLNLMSPKENCNWGTGIERRAKAYSESMKGTYLYDENPKARLIMEYDKDDNEFFLWFSIKAAAEYHKKDYTTIMKNLSGRYKALKNGIYFKYYKREAV